MTKRVDPKFTPKGENASPDHAGRGSSIQGKQQSARGGSMGANEGGAPRGGSRMEPSHLRNGPAGHGTKGRSRPGRTNSNG